MDEMGEGIEACAASTAAMPVSRPNPAAVCPLPFFRGFCISS